MTTSPRQSPQDRWRDPGPPGAPRLERLECEPLSVPLVDPFVIASGSVDSTRSVLVRVQVRWGDARAEGLGEGSCFPPVTREDQPDALRAISSAIPSLLGRTIDGPAALNALLDATLLDFPVARAAVELALLDAIARLLQLPVHVLVSGDRAIAPIETDITLPILPPARMATLAQEWWQRGFRIFKVKVGRAIEEDLASLEAIARATPGARLRVDANGGYDARTAIAFFDAVSASPLVLECFEQPCTSDLEAAEVLRQRTVDVVADESVKTLEDFHRVHGARAATGVNLKIAKSGGLLRCFEIGREAKAAGLSVMVGGMVETRLGMTAATHLVAALGGVDYADLDTAWLLREDPFDGGYEARGPHYSLSGASGFGVRRGEGTVP